MNHMAHGSGLRVYITVSVLFLAVAALSLAVLVDIQNNLTIMRENMMLNAAIQCNCPDPIREEIAESEPSETLTCSVVIDLDGNSTDRYICDVRKK